MREDWKYREFEKCLLKVPKQKAVKSKDYLEDGLFPIVSQESTLVSGYSNDESLVYKHIYPIVIFGDHTKNVKYIDFDFVVGADGVHILSAKDDLIPKFFYYELCSIKLRELGYARHYKLLKQQIIKYPSLPEQQRIVDLLDAEFEKIDQLKANADAQLQAAKDLFQAALKQLLTPKEGWKDYTINDVISDLRTGLNPRVHFKLNTPDADCYYITVRELKGFTIETDAKTDLVNKEAIERINQRSHLQIGDVLFSATGTIGNTALVTEIPENWNIKEGIYVMTPRKEMLDSKYFIYLLGSDYFLKSVRAKAEGTGVKSIAMKNLIKLPISLSTLSEQQQIAKQLDAISEKIKLLQQNYNKTITLCNDLKQALLKSIFA